MIYVTAYIISSVYMLFCFMMVGNKFQKRDKMTLILLILIGFVGVIASLVDGEILTGLIGPAIASVLLYIYYEDLSQQDLYQKNKEKAERIDAMQTSTIIGMANLIESRDGSTGAHIKNTAHYVELLAKAAQKQGISESCTRGCALPSGKMGRKWIPGRVVW